MKWRQHGWNREQSLVPCWDEAFSIGFVRGILDGDDGGQKNSTTVSDHSWKQPNVGHCPTLTCLNCRIAIQQIPAPTGAEAARTQWVGARMEELGLHEIVHDAASNNVYGRWPGAQSHSALLVTAHTDTVFGIDTDLSVRHDAPNGRVYGPGIGDNSMGVAALLELIRGNARIATATCGYLVCCQ